MDQPDQQRDFFVSYTQADRAWAEWLAWELEAAGYTTLLQAWDMPAGTAFVHAMDQAVQHIRHILLVLSPAYLRSQMAEAEWRPGFTADPSGQARRLLPVRVEACQPKGLLADRVYIDLVGADEATARARLRDEIPSALRGPGRPATPPRFPRAPAAATERPRFPTALPRVWNVPYRRNPDVTGRDDLLGSLADQLADGGAAAVTQVLQGGGGVGKTTLAVEYAYRYRSRFDTAWWVRAEQPATLLSDLTDLAVTLALADPAEASQQLAVVAVRRWLADHDRWLLILDNAGAPDMTTGLEVPLARLVDLLPQMPHGQVLVTSRDASWEQHATMEELEVFTPEEGVAFLLSRSGSSDQASATEVATLLGLLPLALEQAGAYVRETRLPLTAYLDRLRRFPALTIGKGRPRDRDPTDTVATTWQVSLEQVQPVLGAVALLEVCAFLGPEEIPRELFAQQLDPPPDELAGLAADPFALDDAVAALRRYALVKASAQTLTVHRLLQQVVRDHLDPPTTTIRLTAAVRLLASLFPRDGYRDPGVWPTCELLLPHAITAAGHAEQLAPERTDQAGHAERDDTMAEETAWLLTWAGGYLFGRARYVDAEALLTRALALKHALYGADQPDAVTVNYLGLVLGAQGDLERAREHYEQALAIDEANYGPEHPEVAATVSNLANILADQGDLDTARPLHERALAIREARLGPDDPDIAESLSNLAFVLAAQGDLAAARRLYERALAIREARLGADHPDIARSLSNLASVLADQGDLDDAHPLYERALAIREARLGAEHPATVRSRAGLAAVVAALENRR